MGYQVYITKKNNWYEDDETHELTQEEWVKYLKSDSEMRLDGFAKTKTSSGEVIKMEHESLAVWLKHSKNKDGKFIVWFSLSSGGNIMVTNPDEEVLQKMFTIADYFNSKVQGEEGEIYDINVSSNRNEEVLEKNIFQFKKPWWKFW